MVKLITPIAAAAAIMAVPISAQQVRAVEPLVERGETLLLVNAEGADKVTPDRMQMEIGVVTTGATAGEALDANSRQMSLVIASLQEFSINPEHIRTTELDVRPQFPNERRSGDRTEIIGYKAENAISVQTMEIDRAGEMVASAFEAGANSIQGPYFNVGDEEANALIRKVERGALAEAREQADNMADALGMRVSRILRVSDREIDFDRSYAKGAGRFIVVTGSRIASTPIEPGQIPVSVEMFVEYALVPK